MKPLSNNWRSPGTLVSIDDRRREPREEADGLIRLFTIEQEHLVLEGQIRDISPSGFRLEHGNQRVRSGDEFRFESPYTSGLARVMWNRIMDSAVETGFFIVSRDLA